MSPYQVFASLLQQGIYLCSIRTMYRLLKEHNAVTDRRNQRRHPKHPKPQLTATQPNQVWNWDITKIPGPRRGERYSLYVVIDLFSRYVVGWTLEKQESAQHARRLMAFACSMQQIEKHQITIHADRGAPMTSSSLYELFEFMGITGSHSRPRVSDDNPFIESHFKTLKYNATYPRRFEGIDHARTYLDSFFSWYNNNHHHINLGLFTPSQVHNGDHVEIQVMRQAALDEAYNQHPERFVLGPPKAPSIPSEVAINPDIHPSIMNLPN